MAGPRRFGGQRLGNAYHQIRTSKSRHLQLKPVLLLFFLSPLVGELLSGSSPPLSFSTVPAYGTYARTVLQHYHLRPQTPRAPALAADDCDRGEALSLGGQHRHLAVQVSRSQSGPEDGPSAPEYKPSVSFPSPLQHLHSWG